MMKDTGLPARGKRKFKVTTDSSHKLPISPNLLDRQLDLASSNRFWAGDITYVWTAESYMYLAVVIGFAMNKCMTRQLVIDALLMAVAYDLVFYSDRGS